jgi:hypothetical protein
MFSDNEVIMELFSKDRFFGIDSFVLAGHFYEERLIFSKNMEIELGRWLCP